MEKPSDVEEVHCKAEDEEGKVSGEHGKVEGEHNKMEGEDGKVKGELGKVDGVHAEADGVDGEVEASDGVDGEVEASDDEVEMTEGQVEELEDEFQRVYTTIEDLFQKIDAATNLGAGHSRISARARLSTSFGLCQLMKLMTVLTNTTRDTDTAATPVRKKFQLQCIYLNQKRHQDGATLPSPERNVCRPYPIKTVAFDGSASSLNLLHTRK
ncbi:hypothetical protein QYE76_005552 [Lolium multiflorum]|uniref:Uncharacterized protein n=1 Tax=Lolium multiflorum TaxID=4521 RepID=A0AAD8RUN7_LOLMU|nr:hypothetical protein QYE76_005552 [Lolium multiflorum]